jgi:hypothetical protein
MCAIFGAAAYSVAVAEQPRKITPLDPPMVPFVLGGTIAWAVAGLALLPFRATLEESGRGTWPAICLAGALLGLPGLVLMIKHDANRRRRRAEAREPQ